MLAGSMFGRAERGDVVVLGELLEAGQQHFGLDLVADFLLEAALDDLARRLAGPEAGDVGVGDQLAELLAEPVVDVVAVDGDLDVLLARADVLDLDAPGGAFRASCRHPPFGHGSGGLGVGSAAVSGVGGVAGVSSSLFRRSWYPAFWVHGGTRRRVCPFV